jgi:acetate kinase
MPERECRYALDVNSLGMPNLRRYGYHGLFHEAACAMAMDFAYKEGSFFPGRCLSICLDTQPEIVAVDGLHPVMVSSGATPLEGLPGQTTAGELDAGIVMKLVQEKKWGPEQINHALTMESGLSGIAGRPVRLDEVLESDDPSLRLARDVFRHRLLLACGSAIAVLGGLDAIIFSGRYASSVHCLGPWLRERLERAYHGRRKFVIHEHTLSQGIDRILADQIRWRPLLDA